MEGSPEAVVLSRVYENFFIDKKNSRRAPLRTLDVSITSETEPEEAYQTTYGSMKDGACRSQLDTIKQEN
jgi:hypothetical protein